MDFHFTYRVVIAGQTVGELDKPCMAIIEPDKIDGGWFPDVVMVDGFVIPDSHPFHDVLVDFVMIHRPRIDQLWAERQRQRALEPEERV